ncbi:MAG: iron complex outermembrane receptor protein [Bacteroidia bacterium]|jgi:outer membrane receptor protein involved in Fe transport
MKRISIINLMLGLLVITSSYAQKPSITGSVIDENEQEVSFATVMLFNKADSAMIKAMASDAMGRFVFQSIDEGKFYIQSTFIGFNKYTSEVFSYDGQSSLTLPAIKLSTAAEQLDDVVVVAQRPIIEVQPDKTVFNVEGSINAQGNTALELLRKSPGVVVDNNDGLVLQGKSGVQIYIDGKMSPLSSADLAIYLRSLQSDQIDAIEIITNPSAKYDAEGNAGIINIRLIKDKTVGTNGTVNVGTSHSENSRYNGSVSLNHRNKKFNAYGSYSIFDGTNANDFFLTRELNGTRYRQVNNMLNENTNHGFKFGTDFFINKNSTIGFLVNGNNSEGDNYGNANTEIEQISTGGIDSLLIASNDNIGTRNNTNFNINYAWRNDDGNSLTIDLDHGRYRNRVSSFQPNTYYLPDASTILQQRTFSNVTPTDIDIYTAKVDWEGNIWGGKFGAGLKTSKIKTDNTFDNFDIENGVYSKNIDRSNNFVYEEQVHAAYVSWQKQLSDKWNFMAGLRAEQTHSVGDLTSAKQNEDENVERDYLNIFPSGGLTYKMDDNNSFRINYSRRIDRPNYQNLNPFEFQLDELSFQKGNPFLRPQYSNSYGFTHTFKNTLSTSMNYTVINDVSTQISEAFGENSAILSFVNLAQQTNLALTVSYPFSVKEWWNVYATVTGYSLHNTANIEGKVIDLTTSAMNFYGQNTFTLPKGFKIEVSGWYNSPAIWAGNWTTDAMFDVSTGISKEMFQKRGNLKVSVSDIFFQNGWSGESSFGELYMRGGGTWESRQLKVNFNYIFGSNQVKGSRKRKTGMEDESNRVGGW